MEGFPQNTGPTLVRGEIVVDELEAGSFAPDTWINLWPEEEEVDASPWKKGVVFVNGFNLGRYWNAGPQRTLYVPGPLLKEGSNEVK
jgi:beta-galactosidase